MHCMQNSSSHNRSQYLVCKTALFFIIGILSQNKMHTNMKKAVGMRIKDGLVYYNVQPSQ